jgi:hypothetical protein
MIGILLQRFSLHLTTLHSIPLHHTSLHFTTLHSTTLHSTSVHFTTLHFTSLHLTPLHCTSLHFTTRHYTSPQFTPLHFTSLHFTALHSNSMHEFIYLFFDSDLRHICRQVCCITRYHHSTMICSHDKLKSLINSAFRNNHIYLTALSASYTLVQRKQTNQEPSDI